MDDWIAALDEAATRVADHLNRLKQLIVVHDDRLEAIESRLTALEAVPSEPDEPEATHVRYEDGHPHESHRWVGSGEYGGGPGSYCGDCGVDIESDEALEPCTATDEPEPEAEPDDTPEEPTGPEPDGFEPLAETHFDSLDEGGFWSGELNGGELYLEVDRSARATFPVGMGDGVAPVYSEADIREHEVTSLFVSFRFKLSEDWQGHDTRVNKVMLMWTHENPVVVANVYGVGRAGRLSSEIRIQDTPFGAENFQPNGLNPEIVLGQWHRWDILLVSNEGDQADGEIHWWIDGTKVGEYTDVRFGTADQSKIWDYVVWRPVWGGRGDRIEVEQYMWMDHIYVSGA